MENKEKKQMLTTELTKEKSGGKQLDTGTVWRF